MDFMKVLDQTVRDLKREVNLKVLKIPEIEQKVLDATSDEPWGPHGSALSEIAHASKKFTECQMITNVLWTRLGDSSANWRHIYKALSVIEYLIANGSERAIDNIIEQSHKISSLAVFEYVEPNGKDVGINVRKKAETILAILGDKEKIQAVRVKAAATRDKYFGLSSTGITYKASSTTNGGAIDDEFFKDTFKDEKRSHKRDDDTKPRKGFSLEKEDSRLKKGMLHNASILKVSAVLPKPGLTLSSSQKTNTLIKDDEFDDFDPRGSSTKIESTNANSPQVDLFGENFVGGLLDSTTSPQVVDLLVHTQANLNLFSDQTANSVSLSETKSLNPTHVSNFDPFYSAFSTESNVFSSNAAHSSNFDPFTAIPLSNTDEFDDLFGSFTSNTSAPVEDSSVGNLSNFDQPSVSVVSPAPRKAPFQVKSGIWADSLNRGLIDLNISASKKTNIASIGIVGGLNDEFNEKERTQPLPRRPIGMGMKTSI